MKSSTATALIIIFVFLNIVGLSMVVRQVQQNLSAAALPATPDQSSPAYSEEVAQLEKFIEEQKTGQQVFDQPISETIGSAECRNLLSDCRNKCQQAFTAGAEATDSAACYTDCEAGYRFCWQ